MIMNLYDQTELNDDMFYAIRNKQLQAVKKTIQDGAQVECYHHQSIKLASEVGDLSIVKYLIAQGADFHTDHNYPFLISCSKGHIDIAQYFIDQGVDSDIQHEGLSWACETDCLISVQFLIEKGCDINRIANFPTVGYYVETWYDDYINKRKFSEQLDLELNNSNKQNTQPKIKI